MISVEQLRGALTALGELPEATLMRLAGAARERRYAKGAILYRAGDRADGLYIVLSGRVHVTRETTNRAAFLHVESEGGVLGEIPVFGGGTFPATACAVMPTRCVHLPTEAIDRLIGDDPAFARFALRRLAQRAHGLLRRIDELTATTITARVAGYLLIRAESLGSDFTLGMSQEALAGELGTAREVIVRALRALVAAGAIERTGRSRFVVRRAALLRAIASR